MRAYISAVNSNSIAISGAPSTLKSLLQQEKFDKAPVPLSIRGPYHASHLHSDADLEKILRLKTSSLSRKLSETTPKLPVMSCVTGSFYNKDQDCKELLLSVVREILTEPLQFQKVLQGCIEKAQNYKGSKCEVVPFGPTHAAQSLSNALNAQTSLEVILRRCPSKKREARADNNGPAGREKLAIVGMAGRFPDAASHEKLWELLEQGLAVHREVPPDRFDVKTHVDPTGKAKNTSHTPYGCWIENPGLFDPRFFNMSPREAFQTDPMQRLALATAYEALEMSGYVPNRTRSTKLDRIGTFYGQTSDDWREINAAQEVDTYFITGGVRAFGPGRINYHFGFSGPSFNIDTACSSSAAAIQLACTSLWAKDCDTAVVGGLSCMTNSDIFAGLSRGQFLSKKGPCATFDNEADGYCRADACATVIIKRLDDAIADKDNVLGVILGTATNHSADAISITHPHGPTQEVLYKGILSKAGVDPREIDYVEMHGTGTQAGDGTEMRSVTNVFAPADPACRRSAEQPLFLGAVKANVGHGEAASGVTALIKCLMMMQKNAIPPHVGIKGTINKTFPKDLSERNVHIAFHKTPFQSKNGRSRRIYVSNFSAAGGNTGLLLEDGPSHTPSQVDPRSTHVVAVTAKSKSSLLKNIENINRYLENNPTTSVADLAYTTTARRIQYNWRVSVTGSDITQIQAELMAKLHGENLAPVLSTPPKIVFLFTGQGSHYAALGKELYENSSVFKDSIREYEKIALIHGFPSFVPLIDGSEMDVDKLSPVVVQLGLVCFEMALARLWASWGITPSAVVGHSLGEYAALNVAGVLSASDTIYLVGKRAQLLVDNCPAGTHAMLAVQESAKVLSETLSGNEDLCVSCLNGSRETVLGGTAEAISNVAGQLGNLGLKCTQLKVPFAFHSAQVDPILDEFERLASSVRFSKEQVPVISSLQGKVLTEPIDAAYLRKHARDPVNFIGGMISAQTGGLIDEKTVWLEVGPHPVCFGMVKTTFGAATTGGPTLRRGESAYKTLSRTLSTLHTAGMAIDWNEYHRDFDSALQLLDLPAYSFDNKNYWIQYEGDWCLTKGKPAAIMPAPTEAVSKLSTSSVQKITSELVNGDEVTVSIESDMSEPALRGVVSGHLVNGAMLCPSSLYADMAMTVCDYAYKLARPDEKNVAMNVSHMQVPKSLIARADGKSQILRLTAKLNAAKGRADLVFSSGEGNSLVEHATCQVTFGKTEKYLSDWARYSYLIQSRIDWLHEAEDQGKAHKIGRGLAYKLFAALVDYDKKYRGMEEVILHSESMEATARVVFQTTEKDGSFFCSPYWIDSVAHISGFIVNGSDAVNSKESVYISHGWESLQVAEPFTADKTYRSYVKMQSQPGKIMAGDVYVFDGDKIVACVGGLKFQCIPRKVLNTLLPPPGMASSRPAPQPTPAPKKVQMPRSSSPQVTMETIGTVNEKLASVTSRALDILASEIGVGLEELVDNVAFSDLGVDSLMSLSVSGRLRDELEIDVHSSDFHNEQTIGEFKKVLSKFERNSPAILNASHRSSTESSLSELERRRASTSTTTYSPNSDTATDEDDESKATTPLDDSGSERGKENDVTEIIRTTIAEEMGFELHEITDTADLVSLGLDSLMSLSILGAIREKTGLSLPADLLTTNKTIREIERSMGFDSKPNKPKSKPALARNESETSIIKPTRSATSVLLQGNSRLATKHVWMVPDGGGSATSYVDIPDLSPEVAVWGLNSPFMKVPEEYNIGVVGMAERFITEIKRRQPSGPYILAGWSAGGVIAFEAVNQLTKMSEEVEQLILIDSPCPDIIEPLPSSLHRWFASIGLLGDGDMSKLPAWLLPHFAASVNALSTYTPQKIDPAKCPVVTAIWCEDGVCHLPTDPRPDPFPYGHAQFLLDNRTDFGPNLWDNYLSIDKFSCHHMPGNHFTVSSLNHSTIKRTTC
jgi:iterative type I PKS product template protein